MANDLTSKLVLLRYSGDVHIKARATRHQFVRRLLNNLQDAMKAQGVPPRVRTSHNRVLVELPAGAPHAFLGRVFGIQSLSPVEARCDADAEVIVRTGAALFRQRVAGKRFAVRARRVGNRNRIPVSSSAIERELGAALLPHAARVDLGSPEVTAYVEVAEGEAFLFAKREPAEGGLPLGVEGRAVTLLSGGFDSAVAAWQLLRRGVVQDYVFCNLGGITHEVGVLRVAQVLAEHWHYGHQPFLYSIDFEAVAAELREKTAKRYWQVLLKRLMLRAGERIARQRRAAAIITGEAVGQVSSQTLQNLAVISRATDAMLLRPLVGSNKETIIAAAEHIGTFELSKVVGEYCDLVPSKPATSASFDVIAAEEARMDLGVLHDAIGRARKFDLRNLGSAQLEIPELEVERLPPGAQLIDLRSKAEFQSWHHPDAVWLEFQQAVAAYPSFARGRAYVLVCQYGLMSAHLAERMRKDGFEAFHFRGGTRALARSLETGQSPVVS
jgi:thiamine biosynthesis protein ThiI